MTCLLAVLLFCLSLTSCVKLGGGGTQHGKDELALYRITNEQAGHEFVKTEQFIVPVGTVIIIKGLEFEPGIFTLTPMQERIVQEVFNSIEEITENTVGDTNAARVAEFKGMEFEIRGYPDGSGRRAERVALAEARAMSVLRFLARLGTPTWRLKAKGIPSEKFTVGGKSGQKFGTVEFVRTR